MSRICVKNIPKYVTEDRMREFFSHGGGEVTDAKLMRTIDGMSRQFGFIGYRTEEEAQQAIKYFNNSYFDMCRITCEIARRIGDPNIPQPWSRYSKLKEDKDEDEKKISGRKDSTSRESEKDSIKKKSDEDDPKLIEFLQVMQPRSKSKLWADDALVARNMGNNGVIPSQKEDEERSVPEELDVNVRVERDNAVQVQSLEKSGNLARVDVVSDMDYFKSRVRKSWSDSESDIENDNDDKGHNNKNNNLSARVHFDGLSNKKVDSSNGTRKKFPKDKQPSEDCADRLSGSGKPSSCNEDAVEEVSEIGRLFIRNLPYTATEDELEELFRKFGNVSEVHLVVDKDTRRSKGFAYVLYNIPESANRALEELDHSTFQGRLLHVMPAKAKNSSLNHETNVSGTHAKTFKLRKEEERKASEAGGNTRAWNSLFMRSDTVIENMARKYGVSKSEVLDREKDDLAVHIALGETEVIDETKKALANAGINVGVLEEFASGKTDRMKRSNHVLLVKNLPYSSTEAELYDMFSKYGRLDKVIFPPTRTLALVVFLEPTEARAAFRGLAYKRFKDAPLYLEWAPNDVLSQSTSSRDQTKGNLTVGEHEVKKLLLEQVVEGILDVDVDPERIESRSLFIKNLNFKTSDESLRKHLSENMRDGRILSIRIKKHMKDGKNVSMGFGFVEFDSMETAANACRELQGTVLDGHALILQLCHAKEDKEVLKKVESDRSSTKLIVRNVAFEATRDDLRKLFSSYGQIKSIRLPKKHGNHRGFAFVEFMTKQEAQNALQALSNTHLYSRHLVLERAMEGETMEELRLRTAAHFANLDSRSHTEQSKKRKRVHIR
ncbi:hypothetical protein Dimus_018581 [Dionaea muscipula]